MHNLRVAKDAALDMMKEKLTDALPDAHHATVTAAKKQVIGAVVWLWCWYYLLYELELVVKSVHFWGLETKRIC